MQAPTHILTGVLVQKIFKGNPTSIPAQFATVLFCYVSHIVLDKIARATYHPATADFTDMFWVTYHLIVLLGTITLLYIYGNEYKWGIIAALLPDIDWIFIHAQSLLKIEFLFYNQPYLHNILHLIFDQIPLLNELNNLPDYRQLPIACFFEIILVLILVIAINAYNRRRRNIHFS